MRIAQFIAKAGICSRRKAEELIKDGQVRVNNQLIISPALNITEQDQVRVNDQLIKTIPKTRLWLYYKPVGLITTHHDPQNRPTIFQKLTKLPRIISVGRLDINSQGLLLLTNNGQLAHYFEKPANNISRIYRVRAYGYGPAISLTEKILCIEGVNYRPNSIKLLSKKNGNSWYEVILTEGKNREIRRVFSHFGLEVNRLIRISYGKYQLGDLRPGEYREVNSEFENYLE